VLTTQAFMGVLTTGSVANGDGGAWLTEMEER
jgi:hypothetical protein